MWCFFGIRCLLKAFVVDEPVFPDKPESEKSSHRDLVWGLVFVMFGVVRKAPSTQISPSFPEDDWDGIAKWSRVKRGSSRNPSLSEAMQGLSYKERLVAGYRKEQFRKGSGKISVVSHLRQHWLMPVTEKLLRPLHASFWSLSCFLNFSIEPLTATEKCSRKSLVMIVNVACNLVILAPLHICGAVPATLC